MSEKLNKVIEVMEECHKRETNCKGCPYYGYMTGECIDILMKDALELLKEYRMTLNKESRVMEEKLMDTRWTTIIKEYLIAEYSDDVYGRRRGIHKMNLLRLNLVERDLFRKEFERLEAELIGKTASEQAAIMKQWQQEIDEQKEVNENDTIPDATAVDVGDNLDIGGCSYAEKAEEKGLVLTIDGATGYFPKEFIVEAIKAYMKQNKGSDNGQAQI